MNLGPLLVWILAVLLLVHPISACIAHNETVFVPHKTELSGVAFCAWKNVVVGDFSKDVHRNGGPVLVPQSPATQRMVISNEFSVRCNRSSGWGNGGQGCCGRAISTVFPYLVGILRVFPYQFSSHLLVETLCSSNLFVKVRGGQWLCGTKRVSPLAAGYDPLLTDIESWGLPGISEHQPNVIKGERTAVFAFLPTHCFGMHKPDPSSLIQSHLFSNGCEAILSSLNLGLRDIELAEHFGRPMRSTSIFDLGLPIQLLNLFGHFAELHLRHYGIGQSGNKGTPSSDSNYFLGGVVSLLIGGALSLYGIWKMNFGAYFWRYVLTIVASVPFLLFGLHLIFNYSLLGR